MDPRLDHLINWASSTIRRKANLDVNASLETVSGDASFRRYFRLRGLGKSWILVDAPPDKEDNPRFIRIAKQWRHQQVEVPQVLAADLDQGFMLLEDFGDQLLWTALHEPDVTEKQILGLYRQAIEQLVQLQGVSCRDLPAYANALLLQEMALFRDWLCEQQLQMTLTDVERAMFDRVFDLLARQALAQPVVTVHRDYHSRNLMLKPDGMLGIIDFQDALAGPSTYDLVSLVRDCYVRWPQGLVDELVAYYWELARPCGYYLGDWQQCVRDVDWMGLQRHLKAAGIFARLNLRDHKPTYLADIPNTCQYLIDIARRYDELSDFSHWLNQRLMPELVQLSR
ncbi:MULTISPECIES: aminoglycoside phosphotransferase family protein [unclassified Oceanobacter]|uniref:aminoglycoside phosphotransferase family protein n=1 Tax=unclassified Oceanobacter TaxID=2620260 RepID=UPI0027354370|nr:MULTISPECIES: phosphotransferase [unclassified Oceanobacter]MDP2609876.1 phosphotransferase [Oceanobacter sp. 1_MG-2023]MDP2612246.1 phosphotransferase [Oceanobacter sp. 2_MG-2023]